jgi:hypothetical protein
MRLHQALIVIFLFLNLPKIKAQSYELGSVTIAELEEKIHPIDSSASAAVLFSKGRVSINANGYTDFGVKTRIKIYKKEGYRWSNVQFAFPAGKVNDIKFTNVYTYNLVDGKIVKSKLKPEGEFIEKNNKRYWIKKITFPDVKEGSVIEYEINKINGGLYIQDWDFQKNIPVNYSEFKTIIPDSFIFTRNTKGFFTPKVVTQIAKTYGYVAKETIYSFQNLPAMKDEEFVNNIDNYRVSISHELETIAVPGQFSKSFSKDWPTVTKTIYEFEDFGPELNKTGYFEDDLKVVLQGKINSDEKITTILDYVKSTMKWNDHFGYGCENGVRKAYKEKTGNSADINLMLTAMLRYSGLTANPVLISTRSNGIAFFPTTDAFNYVIAAVETPTGIVLLDAVDKHSMRNILPLRDLNWIGRLIRKDGTSQEVDLMPKKMSNESISMSYDIGVNGSVKGKVRRQYSEYSAWRFRNSVEGEAEDVYLEKFENENNKIELSEYKRTNEKELLLPVAETFSFTGSSLAEVIGEKIYIDPMLFFTNKKNPFNQEKREYPVDYGFPFTSKYTITIKIPENFTVEYLPNGVSAVMEDNLGSFKYEVAFSDGRIQLSILQQINDPIIQTVKYEMLKEYYKTMIAKETEKIILKKI